MLEDLCWRLMPPWNCYSLDTGPANGWPQLQGNRCRLGIVRKAAERMNGTVGVESTGKGGVNFGFSYTGSAAKMKAAWRL